MADLQIFENPAFGQVRTVVAEDGEPRFCLADVCNSLGLLPKKVSQRLEKDVLSKYPLLTEGGKQEALFVNEDGLYDTIFDSRKPIAKQFRKWVTSEVLPSIRKTGTYTVAANYTAIVKADPQLDAAQAAVGMMVTRNVLENITALYDSVTCCGQKDYADYIILSNLPARNDEVARDYGLTVGELFDHLVKADVVSHHYNNRRCFNGYELTPELRGRGYCQQEIASQIERTMGEHNRFNYNDVWTPKGRLMIYAKLGMIGILPVIDQNKQRMGAIVNHANF